MVAWAEHCGNGELQRCDMPAPESHDTRLSVRNDARTRYPAAGVITLKSAMRP
jgi:hypothetical protein